jgi:hypothetical protein
MEQQLSASNAQPGFVMVQEQFNQVDRLLHLARKSIEGIDKKTPDFNSHEATFGTLFQKVRINAAAPPGKHPQNTLRCLIKGKKNIRMDETLLEEVLCTELNIKADQVTHVYNLGKPTEWFVTLKSDLLFKSLHMREIAQNTKLCSSILLLHVEKKGTRGQLKWVPPTYTQKLVIDILKTVSTPDEPITATRVGKSDKWMVDFQPISKVETLPHFLEVEMGGESHTLLLQINGRRTICPLCGTTKHGPAACRSPFVRERDNIEIDDKGRYVEVEIFSTEDSYTSDEDNTETTQEEEEEKTPKEGSQAAEKSWEKVTNKRRKKKEGNKQQHKQSTRPGVTQKVHFQNERERNQSDHGYKHFTHKERPSTKRSIEETNSPDNHKQTKTGETPEAQPNPWKQ